MLIEKDITFIEPADRKVILITGASGKIGREIARAMAGPKHTLILHAHTNEAEIRRLCGELAGRGSVTIPVQANLASEDGALALVNEIRSAAGEIDILIHAAAPKIGITYPLDWTTEDYSRELEVHLFGFLRICRLALPQMLARQSGVIIPLLSTVIDPSRPKTWSTYTIAKFALTGATVGLATDVAATGVRVVGLMPNSVAADDNAESGETALVNAADLGRLARMITEDAVAFPNGKIVRLDGRTAKVGGVVFQGKEMAF